MNLDYRPEITYNELLERATSFVLGVTVEGESLDHDLWRAALVTVHDLLNERSAVIARSTLDWLHDQLRGEIGVQDLSQQVYELWRYLDTFVVPCEVHMWAHVTDIIGLLYRGEQLPPLEHAHIETNSRDCDGPHEHSTSIILRDEHHPDGRFDQGDLIRLFLPTHTEFEFLVNNDRSITPFQCSWSIDTDEGFESTEITVCEDDRCDIGKTTQRDRFAEQAGY